jgi:hypothetical protein
MPIVPYDPLRKLPDNHPLPPKGEIDIHTGQVRTTKGASFVHPLAKWDTFLDIRTSCSSLSTSETVELAANRVLLLHLCSSHQSTAVFCS